MADLISGANSIVASFGLYSGDFHESLTFWQLWDERSAEVGALDSIDVFRSWLDRAIRAKLVEEFGKDTYRLTSKGIQRYNFLNRMIENYPEVGDVGFSLG